MKIQPSAQKKIRRETGGRELEVSIKWMAFVTTTFMVSMILSIRGWTRIKETYTVIGNSSGGLTRQYKYECWRGSYHMSVTRECVPTTNTTEGQIGHRYICQEKLETKLGTFREQIVTTVARNRIKGEKMGQVLEILGTKVISDDPDKLEAEYRMTIFMFTHSGVSDKPNIVFVVINIALLGAFVRLVLDCRKFDRRERERRRQQDVETSPVTQ